MDYNANNKIKDLRKNLKKLSKIENSLTGTDYEIKTYIKDIVDASTKIIRICDEADMHTLRNFFSYYVPQTLKILESYKSNVDANIKNEISDKFKDEVIGTLSSVLDGLNALTLEIVSKNYNNTSAEMKVLERELNIKGLTKE